MGIFDAMLFKYGAVLVGYAILGLPVFGPGSDSYLKEMSKDPSKITRDYVWNSSLLINLAKAIGKIVASYRDMQNLSGYTSLVYEMKEVIDDLDQGKYHRTLVQGAKFDFHKRGEIVEVEDHISFIDIPIISPNGDVLIEKMNITIK